MDQVIVLVFGRNVGALARLNEELANAGFYPVLSTEPRHAHALAHRERPEALVIDFSSDNPAENWATFRDLQADPMTAATPTVLIVTARRPSWRVNDGFTNDPVVVLQQPILATELVEAVRHAIRRRGGTKLTRLGRLDKAPAQSRHQLNG